MRPIRLAALALVLGAAASLAAYGQTQQYDRRPGPTPQYDDDRGFDEGRGYDYVGSARNEVGFFFDELAPYGDWVLSRDYGWAWFPRDTHPYWRPYSDGRWVNTEYGWTWASNEPFGWATYHYGRWAWDPRFGWLWVPGTIWGPAWVSWQHGGGYLGWAPLPPSVAFETGIGIRLGRFDLSLGIRPDAYTFVRETSFLEPRLSAHLIPSARNVTIIDNTTNITNYTWVDNRVMNRGIAVARMEKMTGRRVPKFSVTESRESRSRARSEVASHEVRIFRPDERKLDAVRVGRRANAGMHVTPPTLARERNRPGTDLRGVAEFEVAPRADRAPRPDAKQVEKRERDGQQELARYQAGEKRRLEKLHGQEVAKARVPAERGRVEQRHRDENDALTQEQQEAAQQLQTRQRARRQAELGNPPGRATSSGKAKGIETKKEDQRTSNGRQR